MRVIILQVSLLHMRMNTLSDAKSLSSKESMGNKAACVIALGEGLPTISQLSNQQGLWIY